MLLDSSPLHEQWRALLDKRLAPYASFSGADSVSLERGLFQAFSSKEAREYGVRIYRGLPRLYHAACPSDARIKKYFSSLPRLKRLAAEKFIFQIYRFKSLPENSKVSLFTYVRRGVLSDYITGMETTEILRDCFPDLELSWVALLPSSMGSPSVPRGCKTHLLFYDRDLNSYQIDKEALAILRTSDLVIQLPTFYPQFEQLQQAVAKIPFSRPFPTWASFGEYGLLESERFHPATENRSMGLHFLEKGILLRKVRSERADFELLENTQWLEWLFDTQNPSPDAIESYWSNHHFYLADLHTPIGGAIYLHALLSSHERDQKGIDLCIPDLSWLIAYLELQAKSGRPPLEAEGVALEIYFNGKFVSLASGKKKLRLFCPSHLSQADFRTLLSISGEFVAIRDDRGFSEIVSENKGFFYDSKSSSRYFMKDLLALAENRIRTHRNTLEIFRGMHQAFLQSLPEEEGQWVEETHFQEKLSWREVALRIGIALQDPDAIAGFKKLNQIIATEFSGNDFLCHFVQRALCHRAYPYHRIVEEELVTRFADGDYSLAQAISKLQEEILQP